MERFAGYLQRVNLEKKEQKLFGIICGNIELSDRAMEIICKYNNIFFSYDFNIVKHLIEIKNIIHSR